MRHFYPMAVVCALLSGHFHTPVGAQTSERLISITESVGQEIDPAERDKYGLFAEHTGFLLAEVVSDGTQQWLRISYRRGQERLVQRSALSDADLQALRARIETHDAQVRAGLRKDVATEAEQEGRLRLVTDGFLYGAYLYAGGTVVLLDLEGRAATGTGLLITGATFGGTLHATRDYRLGYGRTKLVRWGNFAGTLYGIGIPVLLDSDSDKVYAASAMALTPVGGYLAYSLTDGRWVKKGEADLVSTGMYLGAAYGAAIPFLIDISDMKNSDEARVYMASAMAGVPIGAWVTDRMVRGRPINRGRAHLISLGGWLGVADALTIVDIVDNEEHERLYVASAMVGFPAGAYLAYRLTEGGDYTLGRGRMITVGAYAGALATQGLLYTVGGSSETGNNVAGMVGSALGVWFTHRGTEGWGERVTGQPTPGEVTVAWAQPEALLMLGLTSRGEGKPAVPVELVRIEF